MSTDTGMRIFSKPWVLPRAGHFRHDLDEDASHGVPFALHFSQSFLSINFDSGSCLIIGLPSGVLLLLRKGDRIDTSH